MTTTPEAVEIAGCVVRWGVTAAVVYLAGLAVLTLVVRVTSAPGGAGVDLALRLATPGTRRFVAAALGVALSLPVPVLADDPVAGAGANSGEELVLRRLPDDPAPVQPASVPDAATLVTMPAPSTWTVAPGDHLWSIAEQTVASRLGRPPTDAETAPFWRRLLLANRDRLVDPSNPDLLRPGQVVLVPA